jgi:hypothetical protein
VREGGRRGRERWRERQRAGKGERGEERNFYKKAERSQEGRKKFS